MFSLKTLPEPKYQNTKEFPETFNDSLRNAQVIKCFDNARDTIADVLICDPCF